MNQPATLPAEFNDKLGHAFTVRAFDAETDRTQLEQMYETFQPKRAAQGLPPERGYALSRWLDHVLGGGRHLLVRVNDQIYGHLMLIPMAGGDGVELAIFLHQLIRGRGIGTAMNKLAVAIAREDGFKRVWLSVEPGNIPAIRSYQKAGFLTVRYSMYAPELEMEVRF